MRILIVDDSVTARDRLVQALSVLPGVEHVHTAASALEATRAIDSGWPDAIILDVDLPRGTGPRVLEALRAGRPRTLSIVLTNDSTLERREACLQAGADFFFDKAWELQSAIDVVARLARGDAPATALPPCWDYLDRLPIPAWIHDVDTLAFKAVNEAARARYGYSREQFLRMTVADIQACEAWAVSHNIPVKGTSSAYTQQHRDSDGVMLHVEVAVTVVTHEDRRLAAAVVHDVSDRVFAERALRASDQRHRELFENATRLAADVASDFSNLLALIMRRSQEILERLPADDPSRADAVEILSASGQGAGLTQQLLALSTSRS